MSFFLNSDGVSLYSEPGGKKPKDSEQRQTLSLNINERNNQKSLLYQALFLPDKSLDNGGTKHCGPSVNKNITANIMTPPGKGITDHSVFVPDEWNTSRSLSSLSDSNIVNQNSSLSLSSGSSWNSFTNLPSSGSNNHLHQYSSTETFPSMTNAVDEQSVENLHEDQLRNEYPDNLNSHPAVIHTDVSQSSGGIFQVLNNQCYEAAITEQVNPTSRGKYITKKKYSQNLSIGSKGHALHTASATRSRKRQHSDTIQHQHHQHHHHDQGLERPSSVSQDKNISDLQTETDSNADFVAPSTLLTLTASKAESPKSVSPGSSDNSDHKKHRYNQTFIALSQSGLMKTTIRTAELLRRSRSLQQEIAKLRRDTNMFVECVLKNPQNRHLKEQIEKSRNLNVSLNQNYQPQQ